MRTFIFTHLTGGTKNSVGHAAQPALAELVSAMLLFYQEQIVTIVPVYSYKGYPLLNFSFSFEVIFERDKHLFSCGLSYF